MKIVSLTVGPIMGNCYLVYDEDTKDALVVDPGAEGSRIVRQIESLGLKVKYIVNTHGHSDHIGGNSSVKNSTGAKLFIHEEDASMLTDSRRNLSVFMGENLNKPAPDGYLKEGDILEIGKLKFAVIHTPGHTRGGICLFGEGVVFSGDTLFEGSIGRTDLPGGSYNSIIKSIKEKLLVLDDEVVVYPGHGGSTSIGREKVINPFLN